jgi:hypothetical protein
MTTLPTPANALQESERMIELLEQRRDEFPHAEELLAIHRPTHQELERNKRITEQAVTAWRESLAHRWNCEIAGRRLYKQIYQQFTAFYGSADAPEVQLISRGGAEENSSPAELLVDLRRMEAALVVNNERLPFAAQRLSELGEVCTMLDEAIKATNAYESERRTSVLEQRMVQETYRRLCNATRRALTEHYGSQWLLEWSE